MIKLYPPQIPGTLPAFYGNTIRIPFLMNKTVSNKDYTGFALLIKNIQNNKIIATLYSNKTEGDSNKTIVFTVDEDTVNKFTTGSFYKVQLAYYVTSSSDDNQKTIGYYSTVGVIKHTQEPQVSIQGFDASNINYLTSEQFIGVYDNNDPTEKIYSYNFIIKDKNGNIFEESKEIIHNHQAEDFQDSYVLKKELQENETYIITYTATTVNEMVIISPEYKIMKASSIYPFFDIKLQGILNEENAYIKLDFSNSDKKLQNGKFFISKSSSKNNFQIWERIYDFELNKSHIANVTYTDFNIEFGETYKYSLQQYNDNNIYSAKVLSNSIKVKFEHSYLYDGERQLKIKYNPKVSSLKENILESRTNTLGGKYPYFFRNGDVRYKEFPISGLISYLTDEEELFIPKKELEIETGHIYNFDHTETTNLTYHNIKAEQIFKFKVLEFLNNEKPKIFKSPIEGNCLVKLTGTSLSPNDQLGRMLHTFNTTAVECDELNLQNLNKYQITNKENNIYTDQIAYFKTFDLTTPNLSLSSETKDLQIFYLNCQNIRPGTVIEYMENSSDTNKRIRIGQTASYILELPKNNYIHSIDIYKGENGTTKYTPGFITIGYYKNEEVDNTFNNIEQIETTIIPLTQIKSSNFNYGIGEFKDNRNKIKIGDSIIDLSQTYNFSIKEIPGNVIILIGENVILDTSIELCSMIIKGDEQKQRVGKYKKLNFYLEKIESEVSNNAFYG